MEYFNPRPPRGGRPPGLLAGAHPVRFQSTPSARRATVDAVPEVHAHKISIHALREEGDYPRKVTGCRPSYFNPRPPRGGRRYNRTFYGSSDIFQSTPSARRATHIPRHDVLTNYISIHALREEGDPLQTAFRPHICKFQSTPSARRATPVLGAGEYAHLDFNPRPPRGGRQDACNDENQLGKFQSTPSARRATIGYRTSAVFY